MKTLFMIFCLQLSAISWAALQDFNGDYTLTYAVDACNHNARVSIGPSSISIVNPDPRDNRGWSTTQLKLGQTKYSIGGGSNQVVKTSIVGSQVVVETTTVRNGSEQAYNKDVFTFSLKNNVKTLQVSLSVATRGNVSGWGTSCTYEKK
jgi:hypothetical protein